MSLKNTESEINEAEQSEQHRPHESLGSFGPGLRSSAPDPRPCDVDVAPSSASSSAATDDEDMPRVEPKKTFFKPDKNKKLKRVRQRMHVWPAKDLVMRESLICASVDRTMKPTPHSPGKNCQ